MKHELIHTEGSSRLLLIFAGWGMDANVFRDVRRPGYDVMVVWDYSSFFIDWSCTAPYSEICLLAWSMGVFAASQTIQAIDYKTTRRIAMNGTLQPVDNLAGIPEAIFQGTLEGLTEASVAKFNRRMCATRGEYETFIAHAPKRGADELRDELQAIADRLILHTPSRIRWDLAVAGREDRIFPYANQRRSWQDAGVPFETVDAGHYFDFQQLIDRHFIDKGMVGERFGAGTATYSDNATVQTDVVERLMAMVKNLGIDREVMAAKNAVLEIGSGTGTLSRAVAALIADARMVMWDLAAPIPDGLPLGRRYEFSNCDAELAIARVAPESFDHIFSASTMQWFNSPDKFLGDCHRALKPGGYAVLTTYTRGNMHQVQALTGNGLPLLTPEQWTALAEKRFEIAGELAYERDLDFESPLDVLRHLKLTGVNSLGRSSRGNVDVREVMRRYPMMLDGRYHLTYRPFILILRKK